MPISTSEYGVDVRDRKLVKLLYFIPSDCCSLTSIPGTRGVVEGPDSCCIRAEWRGRYSNVAISAIFGCEAARSDVIRTA